MNISLHYLHLYLEELCPKYSFLFKWASLYLNHDSVSLHIITAWHVTSSPIFRLLFPVSKKPSVSWMNMAYYFPFLLSSHWMSITTPVQIRAQLWAHHSCQETYAGTKTQSVSWLGFSLSPSLKLNYLRKIHWNCTFILSHQGWSKREL